MRSSRRYSLIFAVYAESLGCWEIAGAESIARSASARAAGLNITASKRGNRWGNDGRNTLRRVRTLGHRGAAQTLENHIRTATSTRKTEKDRFKASADIPWARRAPT